MFRSQEKASSVVVRKAYTFFVIYFYSHLMQNIKTEKKQYNIVFIRYTLLTHLRDIYMCGRVQQVALGNPNKTILVLVGACHTFGVHEFMKYRVMHY